MVEGLLLVKALDLLVHAIDQEILLLLRFFEVYDVFFGTISSSTSDSDFTLHNFIIFLYLFQSAVKLIKFFLSLQHALELLISLFFASLVLFLKDF